MTENAQRRILAELDYEKPELDKGYANQTLYINLDDNTIRIKPVSEEMKEKFVGGKGFDLWLLWHAVNDDTKWNDPENEICIAAGPLGGTSIYPGAGKSIAVTISPLTGIPVDSNVGGYFGPYLKLAGFDAMEVQGKAGREVLIYIDGENGKVIIEEAPVDMPDESYEISRILMEDHYVSGNPRSISVVSAGTAAKNSSFGILNFSYYDRKRKTIHLKQAGRGGIGRVWADKKIKAVSARCDRVTPGSNNPADFEKVKDAGHSHTSEIRELDPLQNEMARVGTTHIVPIMNEFDLLPTHNYKFGRHPGAENIGSDAYRKIFHEGYDGCWLGCPVACAHCVKDFVPRTGPYKGRKVWVDGPEYETIAGCGSNCGIFDPYHIVEVNFYCDTYGLDTISVGTATAFAMECYELGLITKEHTGGMDLSFGNRDAALEIIHQMARGEGFGMILGQGIRYMKKYFAENFGADPEIMKDIGMETKGLEYSEYMTKESLAQQGGYGMALKGPQHDEAWLIFLDMVHNFMPTFEQKAEALHWFPMFRTWFGLCGLCKLPWNDIVPTDNKDTPEPAKVMKHVKWYAQFFEGVTGRPTTPDDIIRMSERVYNFQKVFNIRMGRGRREHDAIPYRSVGPVTAEEYESRRERYDSQLKEKTGIDPEGMSTVEKMAALRKYREGQYEKLLDAVYERRGWNNNGIPRAEFLKGIGLDYPDVLRVVEPLQ